jgi:UDP-N-acetyl-D-mannosaminuronate dehydrogenase
LLAFWGEKVRENLLGRPIDNLTISEAMAIMEKRQDLSVGSSNGGSSISVAYCPERVLPGRILSELVNNGRCIGGAQSFIEAVFIRI